MKLTGAFRQSLHGSILATLSFLAPCAAADATHFVTLYQFTDGADGGKPGGVVQDKAGVFYGMTGSGGNPSCTGTCSPLGTVFSFSRTAGLKTLINFTGPNGGGYSNTLLLNGNTLYGASGYGSSNDGVIFSVHTDGSNFALLHQFSGADGMSPTGTPQLGANGILYGIASFGGPNAQGVLFSIKPDGTYTILHAFTGGPDGGSPTSLLISTTGELVGSTYQGGAVSTCLPPSGCGVVFNYFTLTNTFAVQYTFSSVHAAEPLLGAIGPGPTVYGSTAYINENDVFALGQNGFQTVARLTVYHSGEQYPGPTLAPDGSLLLTLGPNGYGGEGSLLDVKSGKVRGGYSFLGDAMGGFPSGQPIVSKTSTIIGTTLHDGLCENCGTIYEVTP